MKYIIMCGGDYRQWNTPRQLTVIDGEPIVARTIRLLREAGVEDVAISSNNPAFEQFGVPVLKHDNGYVAYGLGKYNTSWCDAFYPTDEPTCYIFGDVVFSPDAIRTIVETETDDIQFFASAPPFSERYTKPWAEPFAFKVADTDHLKHAVRLTGEYAERGLFFRNPIAWELWQVIYDSPLNYIDFSSYVAINDYTCDVDTVEDAMAIERAMR